MVTRSTPPTTRKTPSASSAKHFAPWPYQRKAIKWLLEKPHSALFLEPGLGKTAISLAAYKVLAAKGYTDGMLVVAPLRVAHSVWPTEVKEWSDFQDLKVVVLHGKDKERLTHEDADIYVINYEGIDWLVNGGHLERMLKEHRFDWLNCDELSKMKNHKAKRFKLLKPYLHRFKRRSGLTGSPASNGLMDLFGQVYVIDRGERLGEYITHFRAKYFVPTGLYDWSPVAGAKEDIQNRIKDIAMHMAADDYLDLPPQVNNVINVDLPPAARKMYDAMEESLLAELEEGAVITAATVAAALSKCKQISNGAVYNDPIDPVTGMPRGKKEFTEVHDAKIEALLDLVDEMQGQQMLVAYEFQHDLARLLAALPNGTPYIGGGSSAKDAGLLERRWNEGSLPILLGHPAAIGHGLNLQKSGAHTICWFSPTWDFELYDQFNRRLRRQGNTADRVVVHHIVARNTVDVQVMGALRSKDRNQKALLEALKVARKGLARSRSR